MLLEVLGRQRLNKVNEVVRVSVQQQPQSYQTRPHHSKTDVFYIAACRRLLTAATGISTTYTNLNFCTFKIKFFLNPNDLSLYNQYDYAAQNPFYEHQQQQSPGADVGFEPPTRPQSFCSGHGYWWFHATDPRGLRLGCYRGKLLWRVFQIECSGGC